MKKTNQTVAWLIALIILTILNYFTYLMCVVPEPNDLIMVLGGLGIALDLIFRIIFLMNLWDDTIKFEINIPNPIGLMLKNYKSKLDKKITLDNLWIDLVLENDEKKIDLILKKIELLKNER